MLDIKFVRENPDIVKQNIKNKFQDEKLPLVDEVIELYGRQLKAKQDAEEIKAKAMISEREETVALATALAQKIIGREVKVEDNRALADEFFASLENGGTEKTKK